MTHRPPTTSGGGGRQDEGVAAGTGGAGNATVGRDVAADDLSSGVGTQVLEWETFH